SPGTVLVTNFNTTQSLNFKEADPSARFPSGFSPNGAPIPLGAGLGPIPTGLGLVNALDGEDVQNQTDANQSFTTLDANIQITPNTDGTDSNSGPATKTWVNARILIAPNATNEVGQPHTFTVTLQKDTGTGVFVAAAGEHVDVTLTDSNGAAHTAPTGSCT